MDKKAKMSEWDAEARLRVTWRVTRSTAVMKR